MRATTVPLRVALYARVSRDGGAERSVDDQLAELRRWACSEGHTVVGEYRDDDVSASRFAKRKVRPGWQDVLSVLADGRANAVATWEQSRNTRDRMVWAALAEALIEAQGVLVVGGKVLDPADPDDGFVADLGAALAVRESAMTRKRVLRAVEARAVEGAWHGPVNWGYKILYDEATGKPLRRVPDPEAAPVVRDVAARLLAGESAGSLARELNARGIRGIRGGTWTPANLVRQVSAPAQAGLRVHRGVVLADVELPGEHVLDRGTYDRLVTLLADPSRRTARTGTQVRMLTGVAVCAVCGGALGTSSRPRPDGRRPISYRCRAALCWSRLADPVDELVSAALLTYLARPDIAAALAEDDPATKEAAERAAALRAELAQAREMHRARKLSLDSLSHAESWMLPELEQLDAAARPRHVPTAVFDLAGAADLPARWEALPVPQRRAIVRALLTVRIGKPSPGNTFDPASVEISRRGVDPEGQTASRAARGSGAHR